LIKTFISTSKAYGAALVVSLYLFSPFRISVTKSNPPIFNLIFGKSSSDGGSSGLFSSSPHFDQLDRDGFDVPKFTPVDFVPKNGNEEKSFDLYKKARIITEDEVIINKIKLPWHEFDMKGLEFICWIELE